MNICNNRGLTLLELIISMSIMSLVIVIAFSFLIYNIKIYKIANNDVLIQRTCTEIMERLTVEAKESVNIIETTNGYQFEKIGGELIEVLYNPSESTLSIDGEQYLFIQDFSIESVASHDNLRVITVIGCRDTETGHFSTTVNLRNFEPIPSTSPAT